MAAEQPAAWVRRCVYCGAQEKGNEGGRCKDSFPHCFQFNWSAIKEATGAR